MAKHDGHGHDMHSADHADGIHKKHKGKRLSTKHGGKHHGK